jgi:methylated-DNA-[protein]-cysteine S-methyltransferase
MPDQLIFSTPIGIISIEGDNESIYSILFLDKETAETNSDNALLQQAKTQLLDYFSGARKTFDLPLKFSGSDFQNRVWSELQQIPFGETSTYMKMAIKLGDVKNIRAAASANGKNPFAIVVPCHRVVGTNGSLMGYAGGLWRKQWLLDHEQKVLGKYNKLF